jgi:hypothetical protein
LEFVFLLAQLREMIPSGYSPKPAQEDQQNYLTTPIEWSDLEAVLGEECELVNGCVHDRPQDC